MRQYEISYTIQDGENENSDTVHHQSKVPLTEKRAVKVIVENFSYGSAGDGEEEEQVKHYMKEGYFCPSGDYREIRDIVWQEVQACPHCSQWMPIECNPIATL